MNDTAKISRIRDLARSKMLELQPFAGEEMNLLQTDPHRSGFVDGEHAMASQILTILNEEEASGQLEEVMVMGR